MYLTKFFQRVLLAAAFTWLFGFSNAQSDPSSSATLALQPIPPGTPGVIPLKEYTNSLTLSIRASHERLFELVDQAVRVSMADPSIAEFLIPNPKFLILLGKKEGTTTMFVWDAAGRKIGIDVVVNANVGCAQTRETEHDSGAAVRRALTTQTVVLSECADPRPPDFKPNSLSSKPRALVAQHLLELIAYGPVDLNPAPFPSKSKTLPAQASKEDWLYLPYPEPGYVFIRSGSATGKTDKTIHLVVSQSRTFQTENKLVSALTTDPVVAEPIVIGTTQFILMGKTPGRTEFEIQTDKGVKEAFNLVVRALGTERPWNAEGNDVKAPSIEVEGLTLMEHLAADTVDLELLLPKFFRADRTITRIATADKELVEVGMVSTKEFMLLAKNTGQTTVAIWDDECNVKKLVVCVRQPSAERVRVLNAHLKNCMTDSTSVVPKAALPTPSSNVEVWNGANRKDLPVCTEEDLQGIKRPLPERRPKNLKPCCH